MLTDPSLLLHSLPFLLEGAWMTLQIAVISIAFGFCGGIAIGIFNCRKKRTPYVGFLFDSYIWIVRGTPLFVQVLIAYYALPEVIGFNLTPFAAGILALGVNSMAYIAEIVRSGINALPDGQWEAAYAIGLSPWKTLKGIILPQMLRVSLPGLTNELIALIKETSILMTIGVAELTKVSKDIVARELDPITIYLAAAAIYLIMTTILSIGSQWMQNRGSI